MHFWLHSQKKAVRSRHTQLVANKTDGRQTADIGTQYKSYSQDSANSITKTTMALSRKGRVSIMLTTSSRPSKTFITDLKTTDLNMVNKKQLII